MKATRQNYCAREWWYRRACNIICFWSSHRCWV